MSQDELQRPNDLVQWAPAPEEEREIAAQFFAAPYPCQNGQLDHREHHELGGIGANGTYYWPPLSANDGGCSGAGECGYIDGCCSYYGHGRGLGQHKKKARASDKQNQENMQSSRCSKNESNCSQVNCSTADRVDGGGNGKAPARQGSATGAQSLYARKRRERINGRLRILQKLVPNGTKVDISTMLEEAVHYVKFLQLQIKMLSSDELWMYAPISYNGMDLGVDLNISPPR